jgi:hypothetical protein
MKNITILDIIKIAKWKNVEKAIKFYYPDDKNDYLPIFKKIQKFPKEDQKIKNERIKLTCKDCLIEEDPFEKLYGEQYYRMFTNKYSLSLRPWKEISNIIISEDTLNHYRFDDIIAHFIWEITFYGDEEEFMKEIKETEKEIKQSLKTKKI